MPTGDEAARPHRQQESRQARAWKHAGQAFIDREIGSNRARLLSRRPNATFTSAGAIGWWSRPQPTGATAPV